VLEITPEIVALPEPPNIAAVLREMVPEAVAAVVLLFKSEPEITKISAVVCPFKSTKAPDLMVVDAVVPNAALFPNLNVPPVTVVAPEYVFVPVKYHTPASFFSKVPVPLITPEAVTSPDPPMMAAPESVIAPDVPAAVELLLTKDPMMVKGSVVEYPFKSKIAPEDIVVAAVVPNAKLLPNFKVPPLTVVVPE
jgi:hypothetical protein